MKEATDHHRVSPEGKSIGLQMAGIADMAIDLLKLEGETDERCKSCAFTLGTVPNGCAQTQLDCMKSVIENVPFMCHQKDKKGWPCHGWYAARVLFNRAEKIKGKFLVSSVPWAFSPPDEPGAVK